MGFACGAREYLINEIDLGLKLCIAIRVILLYILKKDQSLVENRTN